jgi:sugar phosphate isomerase/epimerase
MIGNKKVHLEQIISINTLAYHGYDIPTTLEEIAKLNIGYVEPAFLLQYYENLSEEIFNRQYARELRLIMTENGLKSAALSAHMDLGGAEAVPAFHRRMEFGKEIGAKIIITNVCSYNRADAFFKNAEKLIRLADSLDIIIALENPGSGNNALFGSGENFAPIIRRLGSDRLAVNYDCGNAFTYSRPQIAPEDDLPYIQPFVAHMHLKDFARESWGWSYAEIGTGVINYSAVFQRLLKEDEKIPMSIELPLRFHLDGDSNFISHELPPPLSLEAIGTIMKNSVKFARTALAEGG